MTALGYPISGTLAEIEADVAALGRRAAKTAAQTMLPRSVVLWRGPRAAATKRVAVTLDDGPCELTREYLDVLDAYAAKATFFLVGANCARYPERVDDIAERGHELAGHGYTHRVFPTLEKQELRRELERTEALLPSEARSARFLRPPRGMLNVSTLLTCARMGYTTVLWSRDSMDWRTHATAELVTSFERQPVQPGDILLFHEGQRWTVEALPRVLSLLTQSGYELVTVSQLIGE